MRSLSHSILGFGAATMVGCGLMFAAADSKPQALSPSAHKKIDIETIVNASVVDAWTCWTTAEGLQSFFAPKAQVERHPGGAFEVWFTPDAPPGQRGAEDLKVLSSLPCEMFSFEWSAPQQFSHARPQRAWVVVTFHAIDTSHTRVRLVHLGWDEMIRKNPDHLKEWDDVRMCFEKAWPYVLGNLKRRFEDGPAFDGEGNRLWKD